MRGTKNYGIMFGRQQDDLLVMGYVDAYYAGDLNDGTSTTRYVFILVGAYLLEVYDLISGCTIYN